MFYEGSRHIRASVCDLFTPCRCVIVRTALANPASPRIRVWKASSLDAHATHYHRGHCTQCPTTTASKTGEAVAARVTQDGFVRGPARQVRFNLVIWPCVPHCCTKYALWLTVTHSGLALYRVGARRGALADCLYSKRASLRLCPSLKKFRLRCSPKLEHFLVRGDVVLCIDGVTARQGHSLSTKTGG